MTLGQQKYKMLTWHQRARTSRTTVVVLRLYGYSFLGIVAVAKMGHPKVPKPLLQFYTLAKMRSKHQKLWTFIFSKKNTEFF